MVWVASTSRIWVVPIPNAIAPNAPCVLVCESPQAIVVPGCVMPCSGPTMCTMPWWPVLRSKKVSPNSRAVAPQILDHRVGQRIGEGLAEPVCRHDVVDGRESAVGHGDLEPQVAEHAEGLGAGDLVDEVGAYQQLGLAVGEGADGVGAPTFSKRVFAMGDAGCRAASDALCEPDNNRCCIDWKILV